jgi:hypothetical protein
MQRGFAISGGREVHIYKVNGQLQTYMLRKVRVNKTTSGVMSGAALGAYPALRKFPETYTRHYPRYTTEVNDFTSTIATSPFFRPEYLTDNGGTRRLARKY